MKILKALSICAAVTGLSFVAHADEFVTSFQEHEAVAGQDCDGYAAALGKRFADTYGVRLVEAVCGEFTSKSSWWLQIRYEAEKELTRVGTDRSTSGIGVGGTYKTSEACHADLESEKAFFEQTTGLTAFETFCTSPDYESIAISIGVVAFGESNMQPYTTSGAYFGKIFGLTGNQFQEMLTAGFRNQGAILRQTYTEPSLGYGTLKARYYGPAQLRMAELEFVKLNNPEECLSQVTELNQAWSAYPSLSLATYCHQMFGTGNDLEIVSLVTGEENLRIVHPADEYADFAACMAARPAVVERYRNELNRKIVAGLCGLTEQRRGYQVTLVESRLN